MRIHPRLFREARVNGLLFALTVLLSFLAGGIAVAQSYQLSHVVAGVFLEKRSLGDVNAILQLILLLVLARVLCTVISEMLAGRLTVRIKNHLRAELLAKIDRLGAEHLKNEQTGELATTLLQGVDALDAYFSQYLPQVLVSVMLPLTILAVVFPIDLLTGIIFVLTAPLIPLFMVLIGWAAEALTKRQWKALTHLGSYFLDTLQGIATLKVLGRNRERGDEVRDASERYRQATLAVLRVTFISALALELIATISTALVAVEIGLRLLYGRIAFQQAFFILLIAPDFYLPLRNLSARYHAGMTGVTAAKKIYDLLDVPETRQPVKYAMPQLKAAFSSDFHINVRDLSYVYAGMGAHSLNAIQLDLDSCKHYALAGRSGSGKSTLARILLRFIEPSDGQVLLNGLEMRHFSSHDWRECVGWLPQNPSIFNDTLAGNITLNDARFSTRQVEEALQYAGLTELLSSLPLGLKTPLQEAGARFSGGQLQRVALARVFLRRPYLLILDEPTSHLDPELEQSLDASVQELMRGRTTLTIAHRLTTLEHADEVIFMQEGRIEARGEYSELINTSSAFSDFVAASRRLT